MMERNKSGRKTLQVTFVAAPKGGARKLWKAGAEDDKQ